MKRILVLILFLALIYSPLPAHTQTATPKPKHKAKSSALRKESKAEEADNGLIGLRCMEYYGVSSPLQACIGDRCDAKYKNINDQVKCHIDAVTAVNEVQYGQ